MTKFLNKYSLITLALLLSASVFSQQHKNEFYISGSAGASKLMYQLNTGKNTLQVGGALGLGYKLFFTENIGLSVGIEAALYNGGFKSSILTYKEKLYDDTFKDVDYTATFSNYREKHSLYSLNLPILLHFQTSGKNRFYAAVGGKVCLPVSFSSTRMPINKIHATGYAPLFNTYFDDLEFMGYGEFNKSEKTKHSASNLDLETRIGGILTGELGVKWSLTEKLYLYTAAYVDYGITSISSISKNSKEKHFLPHYGMSTLNSDNENAPITVNSVLNSRYDYNGNDGVKFTKNDKIRPFIIGLKLAISFGVGNRHNQSSEIVSDIAELLPIPDPDPIEKVVPIPLPIPEIKDENLADLTEKEKAKRPTSNIALVIDNYKINGASLTNYWTGFIDELILPLKDESNYDFLLEGHTCDLGSEETNNKLSIERAEMVKKYLIEKGFAPERIKTVGKGEDFPLVPNTSHENRLKNRRVVFIITNTNK